MDSRVASLCKANPWMDELLAETLLKMDDQGKLHSYFEAYENPGPVKEERMRSVSITQEKSLDMITECEGQSPSTSS